ncbi:hypothetical protein MMPV_008655 [Pyropia vietnamensis]
MASAPPPPSRAGAPPHGGFLSLDAQLANYRAYHRHPVNVAIHAVCVPAIFITSLIFLGGIRLPVPPALSAAAASVVAALPPTIRMMMPSPTAATAVAAAYIIYYLSLDARIGSAASLYVLAMAAAAQAYRTTADAASAAAAGSADGVHGAGLGSALMGSGCGNGDAPCVWLLSDAVWGHGLVPPVLRLPAAVWTAGWVAQFVGHGAFEGRRPALVDGFIDAISTAPLFVFIEGVLGLGGWSALRHKLEAGDAAAAGVKNQ